MTATALTQEQGSPDGAEPKECPVHLLPPLERELSTPAEVAEYLENDLSEWLDVLTDAAAYHVNIPDLLLVDVATLVDGLAAHLRTGTPLRIVDASGNGERAAALARFMAEILERDVRGHGPSEGACEMMASTPLLLAQAIADDSKLASEQKRASERAWFKEVSKGR